MACFIELNSQFKTDAQQTSRKVVRENIKAKYRMNLQEYTRSAIFHQAGKHPTVHTFSFDLGISQGFSAVFTVQVNFQLQKIHFRSKLTHHQNFNFLKTFQMFKNLCQNIVMSNFQNPNWLFQIFVQQSTGLISWKRHEKLMESKLTPQFILFFIKSQITHSSLFAKKIALNMAYLSNKITTKSYLRYLSRTNRLLFQQEMRKLTQRTKMKQLLPFLTSDISTLIDDQLKANRVYHPPLEKSPMILSSTFEFQRKIQADNRLYGFLDYEQRIEAHTKTVDKQSLKDKELKFPSFNQKKDRKGIVHEVVIVQQKDKGILFSEGRKNQLMLFNIKMKYNDDDKLSKHQKENCQTFDRYLLGKLPKRPAEKHKMDHVGYQKLIISSLKQDNCSYFPKYYFTKQQNYAFSNYFLSEHIMKFTLHQQTERKGLTYTHRNKLGILTHLSNAIRFLQTKGIVHIDLSPNNIMVSNDLCVKIIDFGESYHPKITEKYLNTNPKKDFKYNPGKTYPYTAPEVFKRSQGFTNQQDMYSLGVNCFKLMFGFTPFRCSQKVIQKTYKDNSFLDRLFFVPEGIEDLGDHNNMYILINLTMRLLSLQESHRPTPTWAHLMLKKLYELYFE